MSCDCATPTRCSSALRRATGWQSCALGIERELLHTLRPVELLVPYADGGSLAELHEVAGEVSRRGHPRGRQSERPRAGTPGGALRALRGRLLVLAIVAAAGQHPAALA